MNTLKSFELPMNELKPYTEEDRKSMTLLRYFHIMDLYVRSDPDIMDLTMREYRLFLDLYRGDAVKPWAKQFTTADISYVLAAVIHYGRQMKLEAHVDGSEVRSAFADVVSAVSYLVESQKKWPQTGWAYQSTQPEIQPKS